MISYEFTPTPNGDNMFSFKGLSTDTKPTETHDGMKIANGSSFLEMDQKDVKFYNADGQTWV